MGVAINVGSMGAKTWAHLLKYDTVLGTLKMDVSHTEDSITVGDETFKCVNGRDPAAMPWKDMDVEIIIESTGAFNSLDGGSKHLEAGAKKVVLTAPRKKTLSSRTLPARPTGWRRRARSLMRALVS